MLTLSEKQFLKNTADQFRSIRLEKKISQRKVYKDTGINIIRIESGSIQNGSILSTFLRISQNVWAHFANV